MNTKERLISIVDHISIIEKYCSECNIRTLNDFVSNPMAMDACITHIGHIGEQMGRISELSPRLFDSYKDINPAEIKSMRNRLFHDYEGIINDVVWEVISENLPELRDAINELLENNSL